MASEIIQALLNKASKTYNASKNNFYVADYKLDGVVSATKSVDDAMSPVKGVDPSYYAVIKNISYATLDIEILPTAKCIPILRQLYFYSISEDAYFDVIISDNIGDTVSYKAHFLQMFDDNYQKEADNKTVVFSLIENF